MNEVIKQSRKKLVFQLLIGLLSIPLLLIGMFALLLLYLYIFSVPEDEPEKIQAHFEAIPGIKVLNSSYDGDLYGPEKISFLVQVAGKGNMEFRNMRQHWFDSTDDLYISEIDSVGLRIRIESINSDSWDAQWGLDVGRKPDHPELYSKGYRNVQEAIAHYDDIANSVKKWPDHPVETSFKRGVSDKVTYTSFKPY